jgi:iron complex transport system ATP-binding protein
VSGPDRAPTWAAGANAGVRPIVELTGVTAAYRERPVLREVGLAVEPGERIAIVGPNGAGKSSLLRVIAGILRPSEGSVRLAGDLVEGLDRLAIARRLAVVPQAVTLPFAARVEEVVGLGRLPHEDPFRGQRPGDRAAVAGAIERVGIGHLLGRDARELSLGERQLVLLAVAVAQEAPVLLLDEPTIHLDLRHQVGTMELLADLNERDGTTILAVLHDLSLARRFFPRLVIVDGGRVVADGPPSEVLDDRRIRDVFGVDPDLVGRALIPSTGSVVAVPQAGVPSPSLTVHATRR